jgi:ATP-dependent DNA helicase RecG
MCPVAAARRTRSSRLSLQWPIMQDASPPSSPPPSLLGPLKYVKGVGPARAACLAKLELHRVCDLLFHFPREYEDVSECKRVDELQDRVPASVAGVIEEVELRELGGGRSILGVLLRNEAQQFLRGVWFNQPFLLPRFPAGLRVLFSGVPRRRGGRWEMRHPLVSEWSEDESLPSGQILPVYPLTEGISQLVMRRITQQVVDQYAGIVDEVLPDEFRDSQRLLPIAEALRGIHRPESREHLAQCRRRFVFQELLVLQLALALRRQRLTGHRRAPPMPCTPRIQARILRLFPFELTAGQLAAIDEIGRDLGRDIPMNRLLQGDVGTGKTVVAMFAMLLAVAHNRQAVLMAPTEVLARQHARNLKQRLAHGKVRIALLTGGQSRGERRATLEAVAAGEVDIVVGTHAIAHAVSGEEMRFARLGLVIIDEQHKFGVRQRANLKQAGLDPHYLVMTATPIPRTIAMTLFGDLDVSTLREAPPGRQVVHTYHGSDEQRERWWEFFRRKLSEGRQGYVIMPLVDNEEDDSLSIGAEQAFEALACDRLEQFRLGLVHGRMSSQEKESAMERFASGETQVLVATSVVEVGVDVANATLMTIEGAHRFGLAQLHQLRGRISRGSHPGYLCFFAEPQTDEATRRLQAFVEIGDGFELAEIDFQLRGPGDLLGIRQHGLPPLRVADLQRDTVELEEARRTAQQLVAGDPELSAPPWARLRAMVLQRYGRALDLGDVG